MVPSLTVKDYNNTIKTLPNEELPGKYDPRDWRRFYVKLF